MIKIIIFVVLKSGPGTPPEWSVLVCNEMRNCAPPNRVSSGAVPSLGACTGRVRFRGITPQNPQFPHKSFFDKKRVCYVATKV